LRLSATERSVPEPLRLSRSHRDRIERLLETSRELTMMLKAPETTAAGALAAIVDPTIQEDDVARMPALAIYSGRARLPNIEDMKQSLPNVEATQMTGTGHFVMMENPSEFNRLLTAFLDRISADASERSGEQRPR